VTVAYEDLDHSLAPNLAYSSFWYLFFQWNLETQLSVRKNPDLPRVHGLHIGVDSFSVQSQAAVENSSGNEAFPRVVPVVETVKQSFTEPPNARTTGSRDLMH
jgi:hypothetical protein